MKAESKKLILQALEAIRDWGPVYSSSGICGNLKARLGHFTDSKTDVNAILDEFSLWSRVSVMRWANYSGSSLYPIPSTNEEIDDPGVAYRVNMGNLWIGTEYACLRWELLDFWIQELKKEKEEQ